MELPFFLSKGSGTLPNNGGLKMDLLLDLELSVGNQFAPMASLGIGKE